MAKAGNIEIHVSSPYPCWCEVRFNGERVFSIHHNELTDLRYAVDKAIQEAILKLPDRDKDEVVLHGYRP